jgi:hypothetical protein
MLSLIKSLFPSKLLGSLPVADPAALLAEVVDNLTPQEESTLFRTIGWVSAGMGALAVGLFVGRELRQRYKFNRRTPYDFYAHSGDEQHDLEFGVGI